MSLLTSLMISSSLAALNTIHEPSVPKFTSPDQTSMNSKEACGHSASPTGEFYQAFPTQFAKPGHFFISSFFPHFSILSKDSLSFVAQARSLVILDPSLSHTPSLSLRQQVLSPLL